MLGAHDATLGWVAAASACCRLRWDKVSQGMQPMEPERRSPQPSQSWCSATAAVWLDRVHVKPVLLPELVAQS